jgi:RsiW-degrading membrane proteinase PrsW (M82 family)
MALTIWASTFQPAATADEMPLTAVSWLAFFMGLLNIPSLVFAIQSLRQRTIKSKKPSLFRKASLAMILWAFLLAAGYFINRSGNTANFLPPLTILTTAIPAWWLVEFSRRGLERPTPSKEWGTVTLGLTVTPVVTMLIELLFLIAVTLVVLVLLGLQPSFLTEMMSISENLSITQGSLEELDQMIYSPASNPTIAAAIFLVIGVVAPFTEEIFKPLAVWLQLHRAIQPKDGFMLGLISGGVFTLLESASLVIQTGSQDWVMATLMRNGTGMLHIGLSGLTGYGLARAKREKRWGIALLYILGATVLHGLWNSMALLNGYSALPVSASMGTSITEILSLIIMAAIFIAVVIITFKINKQLRKETVVQTIAAQKADAVDEQNRQTRL